MAVLDDLLGPAKGPREQIVDMSMRDRYLVGKLASMNSDDGGIEGLKGATSESDTDPVWAGPSSELVATRKTSGRKHHTDVNGYGRQANTLPHHGQRRAEGYRPGDLAPARAS